MRPRNGDNAAAKDSCRGLGDIERLFGSAGEPPWIAEQKPALYKMP